MINIINDSTNPFYNLALEEYFLKIKNFKEDILILWQNSPTIVVGKNQNTFEELNIEYVNSNNIKVVRRLSGGGAVYHDLGNLNFTMIVNNSSLHRNDFSFFSTPVISSLKKIGIEATFSGRNDILIDGKKFSGNAQYYYKDKLLHHGTLLFSSDLTVLSKALNVKKEKFESKGVKSVINRVTNISEYLKEKISLDEFKKLLTKSIFEDRGESINNYTVKEEDNQIINELKDTKYSTWQWNFGSSPKFNYKKAIKLVAGSGTINFSVLKGIIKDFKIYGDFFENRPIEELENLIIGKAYDYSELSSTLNNIKISKFIHNAEEVDVLSLLF